MNNSRPLIGHIDIQNLKIYAHHGVDPQENVVGNYFEVNVNLAFPCADAMADDNLAHTINYAEVMLARFRPAAWLNVPLAYSMADAPPSMARPS